MRTLVRVPVALVAVAAIGAVAASCSAVRPSALTVNGNDISRDSVDRELSAIADNPSLKNEIAATEGTIKSGGSAIWLTHVVTQEVVDREVHRRGIRVTTDDRRAGQAQAANFFGPDSRFALARYKDDGTLDTTFDGGDGKVTTNFTTGFDGAYDVEIDGDGRLVAGGYADRSGGRFAIARYVGTS